VATSATLVRADREVKRLLKSARATSRILKAVEELFDGDFFGRYVVGEGESLDEGEVIEFLRLARADYPEQELVISVTARVGTDEGADRDEAQGDRPRPGTD